MDQLVKDTTFVAIDIETTGLMPVLDKIVEIGAVKFRNNKEIDVFDGLVDPGIPVSQEAYEITGITEEMLKGKPAIEDILPEFIDFLGDAVPIAHNATFESVFLSYDISRFGMKVHEIPLLDTCFLPRSVYPTFSSYALVNLAKNLSIESEIFHRALADARTCMEIFWKCITKIGRMNKLTMAQLQIMNGPSLSLGTGGLLLEDQFYSIRNAIQSGKNVKIVYRDNNGAITIRNVTPLSVNLFHNKAKVEAYCHMRGEKRSFRLDRIIEIR